MNILITGADGFLGQEIADHYSTTSHNVIAATHQDLDLTDKTLVDSFFAENEVDVVLHTAVSYGNTLENFAANLSMYTYLKSHSDKYNMMISFGSGAEFNRLSPIDEVSEDRIYESLPLDYYGLAKNLISRNIKKHNGNIVNLRLFGCFGPYEAETRFIKNSLSRIKQGDPILVNQNKKIDFVSARDLIQVIDHYITSEADLPIDLNVCYAEKCTLLDVGLLINHLTDTAGDIIIDQPGVGSAYCGSGAKLNSLNLKLEGLAVGIQHMIEKNE